MAHKYHNELAALADGLAGCVDMARALPAELSSVRLRVVNDLTMQRNFIANLLQMQLGHDVAATTAVVPGVASILGRPVAVREPVTAEALKPTDPEREQYLAAVTALYEGFGELTDEQIFRKMLSPDFEVVLRGVARRAGVAEYRDAALNTDLLAAIRGGMQQKEQFAGLRAQAAERVAQEGNNGQQQRRQARRK